jgi:hypothetical protein
MMSKVATAKRPTRPMQVAFDQAWVKLINERLRKQVDALDKNRQQFQGSGRKTPELLAWGTNMADVLAEFEKRLKKDGHWGRLEDELGFYGEDRNIVLHAAFRKVDLEPFNLMERYLAHTDDKETTLALACKEYAALLIDLNGFLSLTARNNDQMLAGHLLVLVSFAAILCV